MTVHIAGYPIRVGDQLRQLCAWCGFRLVDDDLANTMVAPGSAVEREGYWQPDSLIDVIDTPGLRSSMLLTRPEDGLLPKNCCAFEFTQSAKEKPVLKLVKSSSDIDSEKQA